MVVHITLHLFCYITLHYMVVYPHITQQEDGPFYTLSYSLLRSTVFGDEMISYFDRVQKLLRPCKICNQLSFC